MKKRLYCMGIALAGVLSLAVARVGSATPCWLCVNPPGTGACLEGGPGKRVCTIQSGTCYLSGSPCGYTRINDLAPDGTVLVAAQLRGPAAAGGEWTFIEISRSVDRNCSGHITSRRYSAAEGSYLRKTTAAITI